VVEECLAKLLPQDWLVFSDDRCRISQGRPPRWLAGRGWHRR
jgi:hypothetical protein